MATADWVILNGKVLTMDAACPRVEALALAGGRILARGTQAEMRALAGPRTRIVDAAGGTVMPGIIDSHVHLFQGSFELSALQLTGVEGAEVLGTRLNDYAAAHPELKLIVGTGAGYDILGGGRHLDRHVLDAMLPDRPVVLLAPDIHTAWANTAALQLAGLLDGAEMPEGSRVVMGDDGRATGTLLETGAFGPVLAHSRSGGRDMAGYVLGADPVPTPGPAERAADKDMLEAGLRHCAAQGITTLHNMDGNFYQLELLDELRREGRLHCRMQMPFHLKNTDPLDRLEEAAEMHRAYRGEMLWSGRVKMFMDGVMESRTALMLRDYPDSPGVRGEAIFAPEVFDEACRRIDAMGLQIAVHAIGDLAVRRTLDGLEAARQANGARDSRHRLEHIEVIDPQDLPRLAALGAVASMQPRHAAFGGWFPPYEEGTVLHEDQKALAFAWPRLRDAGAPLCFSTDWPVVPVDPMGTLQAACAPVDLGPGWPDHAMDRAEVLERMTRLNAWVGFREGDLGQLRPGMRADVAVYDVDLEACPPEDLPGTRPAWTFMDGVPTAQP